jgi:hypothetical protein
MGVIKKMIEKNIYFGAKAESELSSPARLGREPVPLNGRERGGEACR